jgi:hypothetical protein
MNIKQSLCLSCLYWCVFPHIPMLWRHDKVARIRKSHATLHHSFISDVYEPQQITWHRAQNVVSLRVLYKFVNLNSTLVICFRFVFIEMLDKLITCTVCWFKTYIILRKIVYWYTVRLVLCDLTRECWKGSFIY